MSLTPSRIIHLEQDFTSAVALQNWKIIGISKLCCSQILKPTVLRLSVSSDFCKDFCKWPEQLLGAWITFAHGSGHPGFNELLSCITCSFNIYLCTIKGCILSCLFESQNILNWKILTEITESNSWPCSGCSPMVTPCAWEQCPNVS